MTFPLTPVPSGSLSLAGSTVGSLSAAGDAAGSLSAVASPTGTLAVSRSSIFNVTQFGAFGDGVHDDTAAVQLALTSAKATGGVAYLPSGTYLISSTLTLYGGTTLVGAGLGLDVFAGTDSSFAKRGTELRLASGSNCDLIKTENFDTLTGVGNPSVYTIPQRIVVSNLVLDGNKSGNSSGCCLKMYCRSPQLDHVVIQNAAGDGLYTESRTVAGYDEEGLFSNLRVTDCGGNGWKLVGPHDSQIVNAYCARNTSAGFVSSVGGIRVTNMHNWGNGTLNFDVSASDNQFSNCTNDGCGSIAGIRVSAAKVGWRGGAIYGSNAQGEVGVQVGVGDGGSYTVDGCVFDTTWFNFALGAVPIRYMTDGGLTAAHNVFRGPALLNSNTRIVAGNGKTTVTGAQAGNVATLTVADTSRFPASGTLYVAKTGSGGSGISSITYSGKTATTFTGCTGGNAAMTIPDGAVIFQTPSGLTNSNRETWDLEMADGDGTWSRQIGFQGGSSATVFDGRQLTFSGPVSSTRGLGLGFVGTAGGSIYSGSGIPSNSSGADGDYYLRTDTPGTANQRIYVKASGSWSGIV